MFITPSVLKAGRIITSYFQSVMTSLNVSEVLTLYTSTPALPYEMVKIKNGK